jgi:hypothetical protein
VVIFRTETGAEDEVGTAIEGKEIFGSGKVSEDEEVFGTEKIT